MSDAKNRFQVDGDGIVIKKKKEQSLIDKVKRVVKGNK